nr:hypothetical protein [Tanacetum cinerariifolium]
MYPPFIQLLIKKQVGDLSTHTTKYASHALTQKVFANMRRVGKGFSGIEIPLFKGMIVGQVIEEGGDAEEHIEDVTAGDEDEPAEVQEVVDVVTTAKLITKKKQKVKMDEEYARRLHAELNKDVDWNVAIDHVKQKAKEDPNV